MASPSLSDLPPPPTAQSGWPWTEESRAVTDRMQDGSPWPTLSIVTPSYNQGAFLEETIRSVLLQGYPNLEYIVIDGESTDGSVDILEKYDPWIDHWVSRPDDGQADALNRGFQRATGDVLGWLNSDDVYFPGALAAVGRVFRADARRKWVTGRCIGIDEAGKEVKRYPEDGPQTSEAWIYRFLGGSTHVLPQPSTFWTREVWRRFGPLDQSLDFIFDHDFLFKVFHHCGAPARVDSRLAKFRYHDASKTSSRTIEFDRERVEVGLRYVPSLPAGDQVLARALARRTRARLKVYEAIADAREGHLRRAGWHLLRAVLAYPLIVFHRPLLGFVRHYLKGEYS